MSVAKVGAFSTPDSIMNSEQKIIKPEKEGHDSIDNFIRQAIGKEFLRAHDSPQWIQLLHAFDQQGNSKVSKGSKADNLIEGKEHSLDHRNGLTSSSSEINGGNESVHPLKEIKGASEQLQTLKLPDAVVAFAQAAAKANGEPEKYLPGWPLSLPAKVQLQKCDKCSREFCSPINYRRHIRLHRRSLNIDKDSSKNLEFLGAFWDKLSVDEAKEIASFKNVAIEDVAGSSITRALSSLVRKQGFSSLPHAYVKAGATLLDVVHEKPSRFPISSKELFSVLDDASEKTFMCAGTALSVQKFVFDREAGKVALEMKNLVACTSFLLEQNLVKAWIADKDAEARRCQQLLVEEEEAAQKRQAQLLEKKRLKKLKQKEQKAKETPEVKTDPKFCPSDTVDCSSGSTESTSPRVPSEPDFTSPGTSLLGEDPITLEPAESLNCESEPCLRLRLQTEDADQDMYHKKQVGGGRWLPISSHNVPKASRNVPNGMHYGHSPTLKSSLPAKHGNYRDSKTVSSTTFHQVWTRKIKPENEVDSANGRNKLEREYQEPLDLADNCELMIGSISVKLQDGNSHCSINSKQSTFEEKQAKGDSNLHNAGRSAVQLWRPVGRHEHGDSAVLHDARREEMNQDEFLAEAADDVPPSAICSGRQDLSPGRSNNASKEPTDVDLSGLRFSRDVAIAFLAQRWKEVIAADHFVLVLPPETDTADCLESQPTVCSEQSRLESEMAVSLSELAPPGSSILCFRGKAEKSYRLKYVPKQKRNIPDKQANG